MDKKALKLGIWGGAAALTSILSWGILVERRWYALRHLKIPLLREGSHPIRVLHLSDLHLAPWQKDKYQWIKKLVKLKPDLIVNTGDNLGHPAAMPIFREVLREFKGVPGVFVNGSNDYFAPTPKNPFSYFFKPSNKKPKNQPLDSKELIEFLTGEMGWIDLNNRSASLSIRGSDIKLIGVDDPHHCYDKLERILPLACTPTETVLAVTHAPYRRILDAFVSAGAHMIFAGHTHGGQVCLPGFGALVTNCDLPRFQAKGISSWTVGKQSAWLHVSAGLGTSIYAPIRVACRPETTLITLK